MPIIREMVLSINNRPLNDAACTDCSEKCHFTNVKEAQGMFEVISILQNMGCLKANRIADLCLDILEESWAQAASIQIREEDQRMVVNLGRKSELFDFNSCFFTDVLDTDYRKLRKHEAAEQNELMGISQEKTGFGR